MAMTYEQYKTAVDAANPTPILTWYLHRDDRSHEEDDSAIADALASFAGQSYDIEAHYSGMSEEYDFALRRVGKEAGNRSLFNSNQLRSWTEVKATAVTEWGARCERIRVIMASMAHVKGILVADGLVARPSAPTNAATTTLAGLALISATLTPSFHRDTLAYAFAADRALFLPVATLGFPGQSVFWKLGRDAHEGIRPVLSLSSGMNVIKITVVSQDGEHAKVYTLTVTRE